MVEGTVGRLGASWTISDGAVAIVWYWGFKQHGPAKCKACTLTLMLSLIPFHSISKFLKIIAPISKIIYVLLGKLWPFLANWVRGSMWESKDVILLGSQMLEMVWVTLECSGPARAAQGLMWCRESIWAWLHAVYMPGLAHFSGPEEGIYCLFLSLSHFALEDCSLFSC